ncbi:MAG: hypothetical protein OXE59_01660 [Bacteroidetes bacterium]|nr:hypothetical protein [Bacteroidota bacterium]MCY4232441.1 hypothetical protein [Bacteroidota bacterium]
MNSIRSLYSVSLLILAFIASSTSVNAQQYKEDFNSAQEAAKQESWTEARTLFVSAANGADEASDPDVAGRSRQIVARIDYRLGTTALRAEDFETALQHYRNGENVFPAFIKNKYGQGLALKNLDRIDEAIENWTVVMSAPGDRKTSLAAEKAIRDHFISEASAALAKRNARSSDADIALAALSSLTQIMEADADVFYYTALAHYTKGDGGSAISSAQQALAVHSGSRSDKAKIYYVLGEAFVSVNDRDSAIDAFQNAVYGSYKLSAEHYLETL